MSLDSGILDFFSIPNGCTRGCFLLFGFVLHGFPCFFNGNFVLKQNDGTSKKPSPSIILEVKKSPFQNDTKTPKLLFFGQSTNKTWRFFSHDAFVNKKQFCCSFFSGGSHWFQVGFKLEEGFVPFFVRCNFRARQIESPVQKVLREFCVGFGWHDLGFLLLILDLLRVIFEFVSWDLPPCFTTI